MKGRGVRGKINAKVFVGKVELEPTRLIWRLKYETNIVLVMEAEWCNCTCAAVRVELFQRWRLWQRNIVKNDSTPPTIRQQCCCFFVCACVHLFIHPPPHWFFFSSTSSSLQLKSGQWDPVPLSRFACCPAACLAFFQHHLTWGSFNPQGLRTVDTWEAEGEQLLEDTIFFLPISGNGRRQSCESLAKHKDARRRRVY